MGQIRQSFPGGHGRFKKLLFATAAAPVLQMQDYQTSLKLASEKAQRRLIQNGEVNVVSKPRSAALGGGQFFTGSQSAGKTRHLN